MALKELLTDPKNFKFYAGGQGHVSTPNSFGQRSIPFGSDRPDNGNSKQPFIVKPIPGVNQEPGSSFPDFLLRDPKNALNNRVDDLTRISKFLLTPPGLLFTAKQQLLSLQNPIVPGRPNRSSVLAGLYNPLMTLGQTAVAGTGLHIEKQGLYPIFDDNEKYAKVYKDLSKSEDTNRLTQLYKSKIGTGSVSEIFGVSNTPDLLLSYLGGPNVNLTGKTIIKFADQRTGINNPLSTNEKGYFYSGSSLHVNDKPLNLNNALGVTTKAFQLKYVTTGSNINDFNRINKEGSREFNNSVYNSGSTFPDTNTNLTDKLGVFTFRQSDYNNQFILGKQGSTLVQNFITQIKNDLTQSNSVGKASQQLYAFDYKDSKINKETRVGLGNPGKRTFNRSKLTNYDNATVDRINMIPLYHDQYVVDPVNISRDLIKFRFEVIDNAKPEFSTFIHFRAFLGAINDNFKADWGATKYIGRGENFYTYNGFSRDISFTYKVMAQSRAEMKSIYQKLQYLASSLAPDYSNGYMKGNLVRLTIGDYLYIVPGIITNLTYNIPEEASWEIALTEPEGNNQNGTDKGLMETPKYFDVNVSFTPIHDFVPQLGNKKNTALITPSRETNSYLDETQTYNFGNSPPVQKENNKLGPKLSNIDPNNLQQFSTNGSTNGSTNPPVFSPLLFPG
jgi:hypothetical protein